jgi:ABC-type nitrate/sulfonate/bicarbonate transport system permease component
VRAPTWTAAGRVLLAALVVVAALALWELVALRANVFEFPPMHRILDRAWETWPTAEFRAGVEASLARLAIGFAVGASIGVAVGLAMGSSRLARTTLEPLTEILRAIPPIAVVPVAIVLLGPDDEMQVAVIAFGVCFPVLVSTMRGVLAVPPEARDTAAMLQVGPLERVFRVNLPAALPSIAAGLRIAISIGLVLVVVSELTGEGPGLGSYLELKRGQYLVADVYAAILFLGALGFVLNGLFLLLERRVLAWHYGATGEPVR